jgi:hypothetical protein
MVVLFPSLGEVPKQLHPLGKISIPMDQNDWVVYMITEAVSF